MGVASRNFRSELAKEFILPYKDDIKSLKLPPIEYPSIKKEHWKLFVDKVLSQDFQNELKSQVEQGKFQSHWSNDILGYALQKQPNGSRVQGVGQFITPSMYFHVPNAIELARERKMYQESFQFMYAKLEHMNARLNAYINTEVGSSNYPKPKPSTGVQFEIDQQSPKALGKERWETIKAMYEYSMKSLCLFLLVNKIANTGQLCCVAAGPHGAKSPASGRDNSTDRGEPRWQTNSSFSPPPFRIWDCRLQSDGLQHGSRGAPLHGSSLSSQSRGSRSRVSSERFTNHHHSVSDGVLSYSGSPTDNVHEPRWTSPAQKFNIGELPASNMRGSRSQTSWFPHSAERRYGAGVTAASPSFGSPSSFSESSPWELTSKRPFSLPTRNFPSRRSYVSKAVYPLVFHNPVSDCETFGDAETSSVGRLTPGEDHISPSHWLDNNSSTVQKFHRTLTELQRLETSPDPGASSRREGFRWSSASSYDFGFDGERFDIADHIDLESLRSPVGPVAGQKCGVCGKLLSQKSPWSSHRIMRGGDMPTAGVLPCRHVFHAECLEQLTPKTQIHEPPCPLCLKIVGPLEESSSVSEPLQMVLRSVQRSKGIMISEADGDHSNTEASDHIRNKLGRGPRWSDSGSSLKNRLKRHFSFKASKDMFSTKVFHRMGSSSSSRQPVQRQLSIG
ncbi:uncharacterized protein LOC18046236 [Citrus clementina]|nr:uncharacterized protein LOC18046236 [Citrus x clementina]